jgi:hypothetical protein
MEKGIIINVVMYFRRSVMRITAIITITLAFLALSVLAGIYDTSQLFVSSAYADESSQSGGINQVNNDDETDPDLIDIFRSAGEEGANENEQVDQGDEENEESEEVAPESEEEEIAPEESEEPEEQPEISDEEMEDINALPTRKESETNWRDIPGDKIPFFFLIDSSVNGVMDQEEPEIARLKAFKYADQIYNGIPFRYEIGSSTAYLAETMQAVPDAVYMTRRTEYTGVVRFDYEVAIDEGSLDAQREGRTVIVSASEKNESIANSFEESRKKVLSEAIKSAYSHEKAKIPRNTDVLTGVITGYEVLQEGWIREDNSFLLQMRVWVRFDY